VPEAIDTMKFFPKAVEERVAYVPGVNFYPNADGGYNAMRLNFSYSPPEKIVEGIRRLGTALKKELGAA
jgi:DNA-binding transcriptional MocR family regulator